MIAIDNVFLSDDIIEKQFICNLSSCKGACCEVGDAGAPLNSEEKLALKQDFPKIKHLLSPEGLETIKLQGKFVNDVEFGWVTPTINNQLCAYAKKEKSGMIICMIETAYNQGLIDWKKPISCHLFPIKIEKSKLNKNIEYVNYEPRLSICSSGCALGEEKKMPVYQFLKEPLIRKFGTDFYKTLEEIAVYKNNLNE